MSRTTTVAKYLFTRLHQRGIRSVYGVPGDFTLKSLDHLKASGLKWIGNCNELNAGYAADGYSRMRGLSALLTTYGVGELSAINAVAGSYAEDVPVVHIVGTPQWHVQQSGAKVHHTLGDGRSRVFAEVHKEFTVAQANLLDPVKAPEMIDDVIEKCMIHSKPGYIEMPCDMVPKEVSTERLETYVLKDRVEGTIQSEEEQVEVLLKRLYSARQPLLLVDRGDGVQHSIKSKINEFVCMTGIPTLTLPSGAGMIDHTIPNYFGVNAGPVGQIDTLPYVESSDFVIAFGPLNSDTQTLGWKVVPDPAKTVTIGGTFITHGAPAQTIGINAEALMKKLLEKVDRNQINAADTTSLGNFRTITTPPLKPNELDNPIDQTTFYLRLNQYLRPNDVVLLSNGTPILGGRDFVLPSGAQVIASGMWFSIGHMLPAALGAATAQQEADPNSRTILIDGDGNVQVSIQEISTIIRQRLNMTIFIVDNGGYAYERQIHGMNEEYNDLAPWRYLDAANFFGAGMPGNEGYPVDTFRISTWSDLETFLAEERFNDGKGLKLVEVVVGKYDVPEKFKQVFRAAGERL
ncbi:pyruvate decarboxylase [Rhizodiscina lignyota]|uniref:Pyruvate decarboxylase n=1 Tax=Rhizodiscina lignyota TaxID=1504668 RepID=A0A9P4IQ49_9PEZI|nr:pyruvate decarboxylase [Rhizodiscina lignyota]